MNLDIPAEELIAWAARLGSAAVIREVGPWLAFYISRSVRQKALEHPRIDVTLGPSSRS